MLVALLRWPPRHWLVEPPRLSNLASSGDRPPELDADDEPRLCVPSRLQHHAQDAVDAEPGVPEAGVVHLGARSMSQTKASVTTAMALSPEVYPTVPSQHLARVHCSSGVFAGSQVRPLAIALRFCRNR